MKRILIISAVAALLLAAISAQQATAGFGVKGRVAARQSQSYPWHGAYYDYAWGAPVAVLVPPTAESQAHLGSSVGATRVTPIQHQFQYGYPGEPTSGRPGFLPTPRWPSSTDQFGDYYIRGPW